MNKFLLWSLGVLFFVPSVSFAAPLTQAQAESLINVVQTSPGTPANAFTNLITAFSNITIGQAESLIGVVQASPNTPASAFVNLLVSFTQDTSSIIAQASGVTAYANSCNGTPFPACPSGYSFVCGTGTTGGYCSANVATSASNSQIAQQSTQTPSAIVQSAPGLSVHEDDTPAGSLGAFIVTVTGASTTDPYAGADTVLVPTMIFHLSNLSSLPVTMNGKLTVSLVGPNDKTYEATEQVGAETSGTISFTNVLLPVGGYDMVLWEGTVQNGTPLGALPAYSARPAFSFNPSTDWVGAATLSGHVDPLPNLTINSLPGV